MRASSEQQTVSGVARLARKRSVPLVAFGAAAALVTAAALVGTGGSSAGADTQTSRAAGRFLTGSAAGTSFDTVAALNGEEASYPDNPGPNENDLSGKLLGQAIAGPTKNISVPFPSGITLGAVGQYAKANSDGSAVGSSGLVGSNGAINVGGSGNDDFATIDLSKLPMASQLTDVLGNLKLTVGAVSARAKQAAFDKKIADPSAGCKGGTYGRVSASDQAGSYQFANLKLAATSPLLQTLGKALTTNLANGAEQFAATANGLPGGLIKITGLPTADEFAKDFSISLADGGVTASLVDGSFTVDMAKLLRSAGLDLNNLCPNTSLIPYLAKALADLPTAINDVLKALPAKFEAALGDAKITIGGQELNSDQAKTITDAIAGGGDALAGALTSGFTQFKDALQPGLDALTENLLDVVVNAQKESGGTFTQTAVQLNLIPNGGSLPDLPGVPSLPTTVPTSPPSPPTGDQTTGGAGSTNNGSGDDGSGSGSSPTTKSPGSDTSGSESSSSSGGVGGVLRKIPHTFLADNVRALPKGAPLAATASSDPVLQLNLASAAVTNDEPAAGSASPTRSAAVAAESALPTGVPAGQALVRKDDGSPALPLLLAALGVLAAGTGALSLRLQLRSRRQTH